VSNFFDPSNQKETTTTTPSPADQAAAKFRADLLGQLLNASARPKPTFAQYAGGQGYPQMPGGLGGGIADVLSAMAQPGAFTSTQTGTLQPSAPSMFSDLLQGGLTGALLLNALSGTGLASKIGNILSGVGGGLGIGGVNPALGDVTPDAQAAADAIAAGAGGAGAGAAFPGVSGSDFSASPDSLSFDATNIDPEVLNWLMTL